MSNYSYLLLYFFFLYVWCPPLKINVNSFILSKPEAPGGKAAPWSTNWHGACDSPLAWILSWLLGVDSGAGGDPQSGIGKASKESVTVVVIAAGGFFFFLNNWQLCEFLGLSQWCLSVGAPLFQASSQPNVPWCQRSRICSPLWQFLLCCGYQLLGQELAGKRSQVLTGTQIGKKGSWAPRNPWPCWSDGWLLGLENVLSTLPLAFHIPLISPLALTSFTFPGHTWLWFCTKFRRKQLADAWRAAEGGQAGTFDRLTTRMFNLSGHSARIWNVGKLECSECWKRKIFVHRSHSVCFLLPVSLKERGRVGTEVPGLGSWSCVWRLGTWTGEGGAFLGGACVRLPDPCRGMWLRLNLRETKRGLAVYAEGNLFFQFCWLGTSSRPIGSWKVFNFQSPGLSLLCLILDLLSHHCLVLVWWSVCLGDFCGGCSLPGGSRPRSPDHSGDSCVYSHVFGLTC